MHRKQQVIVAAVKQSISREEAQHLVRSMGCRLQLVIDFPLSILNNPDV